MNVPPQTPTYSAIETHEAGGEGNKEEYNVLQWVAEAVGSYFMETKEEHDTFNTGEV